ncbi:hypothetical protein Taro_037529 [Colocasia esculenta]|uniref:Uncharacterized protein n=1 Tax=Colocasia esculenta TaxID=4460 RepID=A0A843WGJ3_COLES|nr:hypothetical protein [Colocasia esculenta]
MEVGGLQISAALPSASLERAPLPSPLRLRHHLFSPPSHRAAASFQRSCAPATPISSFRVGHRAAPPESSRQRARVVYSGGDGEDDVLGIGEEAAASTSSPSSSSPYAVATAAFLSLSEKPDRSLALLDEYEMDELDPPDPNHRSGYVAVLGKPNVGKSTLSNQMIGQKLSIVTDKPQTTRHRILGICSGAEYQMILYDTPGVIERKMHKLDSMMMKNVRSATVNADCVLVVVDACKVPQKIDEVLEEGVGNLKDKLPVLLVLNKKDMIKPGEIAKRLEWYQKFTDVDEVIPVSAKYGQGIDDVKEWILSKLPFGPAYYPKDIASEHPERFFVAEIVREKIFLQYRNEVPYACQVNVVNYISRPASKDYIVVEIVVEKNSQKIILIGKEGKALKLLATAARLDIEDFLQKKVYLEVEVKVKANWRQDEGLLKRYGYGGQIQLL